VPLALTVGMLVIIVVYVAVNASYHLVLPMASVAGSEAVAAEMCRALFGGIGGQVAALGVMFSTFGAVNSNLLTGPRIYFAMARDGLLPATIHRIHGKFQTPYMAIAIQAVWSIVLIIAAYAYAGHANPLKADPGKAFEALTNFVIFGGSLFYALAVGAVFVLRFSRPDLPRPYRTWGYPVTPALYLVAFVAALTSMLIETWVETASGTILIAAGLVFYFFARRRLDRAGQGTAGKPE
jgi:APA family basic amino acid/polyamine antiporter